jgi:hypothetical protein
MKSDWNLLYSQAGMNGHLEKRMQQDFACHPCFGHCSAKIAFLN